MSRYCAGCLTRAPEWPRCPNPECRWDESAHPDIHEYHPRHTLLRGKYYIGRVLGRGAFGVTYLALDLSVRNKVAIKEYLPMGQCFRKQHDRQTVHPIDTQRQHFDYGLDCFLNEVEALGKLSHPNIVDVKGCEQTNGTAYMVMGYVDGCTLKEHLAARGGRIPYTEAFQLLTPVMDALGAVHRNRLVHRDISPDNIMIAKDGTVKLVDFGAARYAIGEQSMTLTQILKPGYAPEEQYRSRGNQGGWTDVYAVSATMYHCITGKIPPPSPDRAITDELARPTSLCPEMGAWREDALLMGLAVKADDRFATMEALRLALSAQPSEPARTSVAEYPAPPSLDWAVVLLLSLPTVGLFGLMWAFVQARHVRRLHARSKATLYFSIATICLAGILACWLVLAAYAMGDPESVRMDTEATMVAAGISAALGVLGVIVSCLGVFQMRRGLLEHYNDVEPIGLRLSGPATFFFHILYLQHHLSRIAAEKKMEGVRG